MGIPREQFLDSDIDEEFQCTICHDVLEEAMMIDPCEHAFCKACIEQWHASGSKTCPIDRQWATGLKKPPRLFLNLLNKLRLRCSFHGDGCRAPLTLGDFPDHRKKCEFNPDNPKDCAGGCGAFLKAGQRQTHNCVQYLKARLSAMQQALSIKEQDLETKEADLRIKELVLKMNDRELKAKAQQMKVKELQLKVDEERLAIREHQLRIKEQELDEPCRKRGKMQDDDEDEDDTQDSDDSDSDMESDSQADQPSLPLSVVGSIGKQQFEDGASASDDSEEPTASTSTANQGQRLILRITRAQIEGGNSGNGNNSNSN